MYSMDIKGFGLGLLIVKSIIDAMGGRIAVKSEAGRGTEITVDLFVEVPKQTAKKEVKISPSVSLNEMNILIADDNNINLLVMKRLLEKAGCNTGIAREGYKCINAFFASSKWDFYAIFMDVSMPKLTE